MNIYRHIASQHKILEWNLVDGGCDVLMNGSEFGLGTPQEDYLSLYCSNLLVREYKIPTSRVYTVGAPLEQKDGILLIDIKKHTNEADTQWQWSLEQPEIQFYSKVAQDAHADVSSIQSLINCEFGGAHRYLFSIKLVGAERRTIEFGLS